MNITMYAPVSPVAPGSVNLPDGSVVTINAIDRSVVVDAKFATVLINAGFSLAPTTDFNLLLGEDFTAPGAPPNAASFYTPLVQKIVGAAPPTVAVVADQSFGVNRAALTADNQKQEAYIYFGDNRVVDITKDAIVEMRVKPSTLPTSGTKMILGGLCSDWADGPDAIARSAWFALAGDGVLLLETDDATTDKSENSGWTLTADRFFNLKIDLTDLASVKFYADETRLLPDVVFDLSGITGANALMQFLCGPYKASGTSVGALDIDYVRVWQKRAV